MTKSSKEHFSAEFGAALQLAVGEMLGVLFSSNRGALDIPAPLVANDFYPFFI